MAKDNDAIERIRANQNRIQSANLTNQENNFFSNPDNIGMYEEEEEGASGAADGGGTTNKAGLNLLNVLNKTRKIRRYIALAIIASIVLMVILIATIFTNEDWKGFFLTDNAKNGSSSNGSSSSSIKTPSGTKTSLAKISEMYKSTLIENESFFADLKGISKNYKEYELEDGTSLTDGEFDIAIVAATIHYNKFITDATVLSGQFSSTRSVSNMGIATTRRLTTIPTYDIKTFYELASITLGSDLGIPEEQFRGISGHLVGSRVISACVSNPGAYLPNKKIGNYSLLDSMIIRYESLYYSGVPVDEENDYTNTLKKRLKTMRDNGTFEDYYDMSKYDPDINCGGGTAVHYVQKYMNYDTYAKYLLTEYVPENYLECVDCKSSDKKTDSIQITKAIFDNRNQFVSYYYDDKIVDIQKFSNGDALTTTNSEYQLPDAIKENFTSPFSLNTKCTISSGFTSNRTGYSHYAVDAYANDRTLHSVGDGVVIAVVNNINYSLNVTNGVCLDSNGNIDDRSAGNFVAIKHTVDGKDYVSYYMHMDSVSVKPGQTVSKGEKIGVEGSTGCSTGYHVHFQLTSGQTRYDPTLLFAQCDGASVVNYTSTTMDSFLNKIFPNYTYTNINGCNVKVYNDKSKSSYSSMTLENYVAGVVNNEMPASYNFEALKAQAIAARSYHVANSNYCSKEGITDNGEGYQTFKKIDTKTDKTDIAVMLATRDTAGMLETYSFGVYGTEYANFPCEIVYRCYDYDNYEPYYIKANDAVTCKHKRTGEFDDSQLHKSNNARPGSKADTACPKEGSKGSFYYCGETKYPRQFRNQADIKPEVDKCEKLSVILKPHSIYGKRYRTLEAPIDSLKVGESTIVYQGMKWEEDYSDFSGHNRGMSQVLANYYANYYGWNYIKILSYFYDNNIEYDLVNVDTPTILLDDQTEYEANDYNGRITMTVGSLKILVPVDFYVAGMLYNNFGPNTNSTLLRALAVSNRTWAYNKTKWGYNILTPTGKYAYDYTDSKLVYDAVNATKNTLLVDKDGYITPTEYYHIGSNGTISSTGKEKTITYELGYQFKSDTHKVMIEYDEDFYKLPGLSSGNIGLIYDVATYMANNWYFVNHFEILKFFYGESYDVVDMGNMQHAGDSKKSDGTVEDFKGGTTPGSSGGTTGGTTGGSTGGSTGGGSKPGIGFEIPNQGTISISTPALNEANLSLEEYVKENGYGTMQGVLAAAYWLWEKSRVGGELTVPYQWGGKYNQNGINPRWGQLTGSSERLKTHYGLDCTGFISWAFKNGGVNLPSAFRETKTHLENEGMLSSDYYYDIANPKSGRPLYDYLNAGAIQVGDVLWRYWGDLGTTSAHVAIVYDIDEENGRIYILHAPGNDKSTYNRTGKLVGIKLTYIDAKTGKMESGNNHNYTAVIRYSQFTEEMFK